jgi:hypothetical protein
MINTASLLPNNSPAANSTYPKGGISCSKDSFVFNQTLVFQIKFCGKSPALRVAAKRWQKPLSNTKRNRNAKKRIFYDGERIF